MLRRKKPDLLAMLAVIVGLGIIATSLAQGMINPPAEMARLASTNIQTQGTAPLEHQPLVQVRPTRH